MLGIVGDRMMTIPARLLECWQLDGLIFLATNLAPTTRLRAFKLRCRTRKDLRQLLIQEAVQWQHRLADIDFDDFSNLADRCSREPQWNTEWNAEGPLYRDNGRSAAAGAAGLAAQRPQPQATQPAAAVAEQHLTRQLAQRTAEAEASEQHLATQTQELLTSAAAQDVQALIASRWFSKPAGPGEELRRLRLELAESRAQVQVAEMKAEAKHADAQRLAEGRARKLRRDTEQQHERQVLQTLRPGLSLGVIGAAWPDTMVTLCWVDVFAAAHHAKARRCWRRKRSGTLRSWPALQHLRLQMC